LEELLFLSNGKVIHLEISAIAVLPIRCLNLKL
jgi:hypothetical protein